MRHPLFSRNCHEIWSLNGIVQRRSPYFTCVLERATTTTTIQLTRQFININNTLDSSRQTIVSFSLWHFETLVRHIATLWDSLKCNPHKYIQADKCWLARVQWLLSIRHNPHRRSKPINVGLWKRKSSRAACTEHKPRFSVLHCVKKSYVINTWKNNETNASDYKRKNTNQVNKRIRLSWELNREALTTKLKS